MLARRVVAPLERLASQLQRDHGVDETLLRAVVQVAHHAAALVVGRGHDPGTRLGELRPRLDVRDRRGDELGELADPRLGSRRERLGVPRGDDDRAPQPSVDDDRTADCGADAPRRGRRRRSRRWPSRSRRPAPAGRFAARPRGRCGPPRNARPDRQDVGLAPVRDDRGRPVGVVARHLHGVHVEEASHLPGDRGEHLPRRRLAGDHRRHMPQRGLLVGEPSHLLARLGVRQRRGHELGERLDPRLGVRRHRLVGLRRDDHHAPRALVDDDRRAGRRAEAQVSDQLHLRAGDVVQAVQSCRPTGPRDQRRDSGPVEHDPRADRPLGAAAFPSAHGGHRAVALEPAQVRSVDIEQPADLARDRGEHVRRRRPHAPRASPRAGARPARPRAGSPRPAPRHSTARWPRAR